MNPCGRGTACKGPAPRAGGAMAGQAAAPFWGVPPPRAAMMAGGAASMVGPGGQGDGGGLGPGCEGESEGL